MNGGVGHAETAGQTTCRRCRKPVRVIGDDPLLPESMRKAVHEGGGEMCAGGEELVAPIRPDLAAGP
jgi:hypothetical protein